MSKEDGHYLSLVQKWMSLLQNWTQA